MKNFNFVPPNQFTLIATLLGVLLACDLDASEQNAIGNFFVSIGQSTLTNAAQVENQKAHNIDSDICKQIDSLSAQLDEIKKNLKHR